MSLLKVRKFKFLKKDKIKKLPKRSGVYCFLNKERRKLYIGKASDIRERAKNHFQQPGFKDYLFLDKVKKIGYIKTDSEIEALILEAHLIKKYQPKFNIIWRDDKNYFFVGITEEDFPRIFITHQLFWESRIKKKTSHNSSFIIHNSKFKYVGPFVDGKSLKKTLKVLRRIFPYRSCKTFPKRPCLWYQLGRCPAPCLLKQAKLSNQIPGFKEKLKKECQENAKNLLRILQGKRTQVLKNLKKEMKRKAKSKDFEKAAKIRDRIFVLEKTFNNAKILKVTEPKIRYSEIEKELRRILKTKKTTTRKRAPISRIEAYDVSNISGKLATGAMVTFIKGRPAKEFYRKFKIKISGKPNDIAMIKEILSRRLKHSEWGKPDLILIDGGRAQLNVALNCLTSGLKHIKVMAIAKKKNKLYIKKRKKPILLKSLPREIFNLILQLRDEAHRFALVYHRKLRKEKMLTRN